MILLCGGTGILGGRVASRLVERGVAVRALVRDQSDASALQQLGAEVVRGDLREPETLKAAVADVDTVITTANTMARVLGGEKGLTIADVDQRGNANLIAAAEAAGVERFVFVSFQGSILDAGTPFANAKRETEARLARSSMRQVVVRPDMFAEVWLSPLVSFNWPEKSFTIFGKGDTKHRYLLVDDIAQGMVGWALDDDPPSMVEFGGPEAMTRNEAVEMFEEAIGTPVRRRYVPRAALSVGSSLLRWPKPNLASVMGQSLFADRFPSVADDTPLRNLGVSPTPASAYIRQVVTAG